MPSIEGKIKANLVALSENLTNTHKVLLHLVEKDILSVQEIDTIKRKDQFEGNSELFLYLIKRNVDQIWEPLKIILLSTGNGHLVQLLQLNDSSNGELSVIEDVDLTLVGSHSLRLRDFDNFEVIGAGVFGAVMKARLKKNERKYAIKITRENSHREINALLRSEHQNIVKFENAWKETITDDSLELHSRFDDYIGLSIYCIQMELCNGRDISAWILKPPSQKTAEDAKQICFQISLGVQSLHFKNIIHRDLKPANILLLNCFRKGDKNIIVKIGDLGLSKQTYLESKASRKSLMTNCGTEHYKSPEQETERDYDVLTDIFSMGIIFFEVLYSTVEKKEITIANIRRGLLPNNFNNVFHSEAKLIKTMLSHNPNDRPNADSVTDQLNSLWYSKVTRHLGANKENIDKCDVVENPSDIECCRSVPYAEGDDVDAKELDEESSTDVSEDETLDDEVFLENYGVKQWNASAKYTSSESIYCLRSNLRVPHSNEQLNQLAEILQHNPVAVKIAYLTLNKRRCDMKAYLDRYITIGKHEIIQDGDLLQIKYPPKFFWEVLEALETLSVPSYSAECKEGHITLTISSKVALNELKIQFHSRDQLDSLTFKDIDIPKNVGILDVENPYNDIPAHIPEFRVKNLHCSTEEITLTNCTLVSHEKVTPRKLRLANIKVVENGEDLTIFDLSHFVDFERLNELFVHDNLGTTKLSVDLSQLVNLDVLDLNCSELFNWTGSTAVINKLILQNCNLNEKTLMTIRELHATSTVDLLCIPLSVEKLFLENCTSYCRTESSLAELLNLKHLSILSNQIEKFTDLVRCPNLETLIISLGTSSRDSMIPKQKFLEFLKFSKKINKMRLNNIPVNFSGIRRLHTLILYSYPSTKMYLTLKNFLAENLVLRFKYPIKSHEVDKVLQLFQNFNKRKTIAIGEFDLNEEEFAESNLKLYAERNARFYLFANNVGTHLNEEQFENICNL